MDNIGMEQYNEKSLKLYMINKLVSVIKTASIHVRAMSRRAHLKNTRSFDYDKICYGKKWSNEYAMFCFWKLIVHHGSLKMIVFAYPKPPFYIS